VSGSVKVLDENRRLKSYTEYKDGMKHGLEVLWNDSGIKIYEISFANGKQHGTETTWDDDGTISSLNIYDNGVLVPPPQE
jgi:antitoxin component YwqK of YwqJK toxin-antitoxin module